MDIASDSIERVTRSSGKVIYLTSYRGLTRARTVGGPTRVWHHALGTTLNAPTAHGETGNGAREAAVIKEWSRWSERLERPDR
ncbi:hypothetical protein Caci_0749 [Catenulispora acidiphila DSM 44928]|uniref:Uncharacterized protein n=1 Tax=Catenulispora acidiphila (strain DSM 44928 / JCM 14897 / NBRC 102108 / NRRL B-24433 / ID139908) TaxID=479433 RepID=C7Q0Q6_CATAD|nr:hypothetical protein Caci_0749 [Catenulispora acidiphila DSM 44928]